MVIVNTTVNLFVLSADITIKIANKPFIQIFW